MERLLFEGVVFYTHGVNGRKERGKQSCPKEIRWQVMLSVYAEH